MIPEKQPKRKRRSTSGSLLHAQLESQRLQRSAEPATDEILRKLTDMALRGEKIGEPDPSSNNQA